MMPSRRQTLAWLGSVPVAAGVTGVRAQAPQPEPIKVVIAFPPGGTSTASMRPLLPFLGEALGAPVTLDYKPGAGGDLAAFAVAKAPADGRTLLFGHAGPLAINPHLLNQTFFDPMKDLEPIAQVIGFPIVVCAHERLQAKTLSDLITAGKARPLVTGSSGNGSMQHLAGEVLRRSFGISTLHIPFAGGGPLQEALVKGALDIVCETGANVVKHIQEGRLSPIAVMAEKRLESLPEVPTFIELGESNLVIDAWFGLLGPTGMPPQMLAGIEAATLRALGRDEVKAAYAAIGGLAAPLDRHAFAAKIKQEDARWGEVIRAGRISPLGIETGLRDRR
jgi:tripartite-type tricarboxylate transporter receptor subunit TctC